MTFDVSGDHYDRFMGRFSRPLAPLFADFAGIEGGMRALDVGVGSGNLARELVARVGQERVAAIDPSPQFVEAVRSELPEADVRRGPAEELPWEDASFDAVLAQLVVSFMADAATGVAEMRRVLRPGGVLALCMWDLDRMQMLRAISVAGRKTTPDAPEGHGRLRNRTKSELRALLVDAGLQDVETGELAVEARYEEFDELWDALLTGAGPARAYVDTLDDERRVAFREQLRSEVGDPAGPFVLSAVAWAVRGRS